MNKVFLLIFVMIIFVSETFAYAIKVYDEYGNRVGTYKKEGDNYALYDFYDKKIDDPSTLIQNAPNQKTLTQYTQTFYDENMLPVFSYTSGFYGNNGIYYPRGFYPPRAWLPSPTCPSIIRPRSTITSVKTDTTSTNSIRNKLLINRGKATNVIKTGF